MNSPIPKWSDISPASKQAVINELDECKWESAPTNPTMAYAFASAADLLAGKHRPALAEAIDSLIAATGTGTPEFTAQQYLEVRQNGREVSLGGNSNGLIWLALQCLSLATKDAGSHLHIDIVSADVSEVPLILHCCNREEM
ncbi:MAG: Imm32 family immunity protein [Verrucomicrobiota bacterium]